MDEMAASIGIVTETWLSDGEGIEEDVDDLIHRAGLGFLYQNREPNNRGVSHGCVGIFFNMFDLSLAPVKMPNPRDFEVLMAIGMVKGISHKIVVIACYLPPNYVVRRA